MAEEADPPLIASGTRLPNCTFAAFERFLVHTRQRPTAERKRVTRPPSMMPPEWDQVHSTLTTLRLLDTENSPTLLWHSLVDKNVDTEHVLRKAYGDSVVDAVLNGSLCADDYAGRKPSVAAVTRFLSFVRESLREGSKEPKSGKAVKADRSNRRSSKATKVSPADVSLRLLEEEGQIYLSRMKEVADDPTMLKEYQRLMGDVHDRLGQLR